MKFTLMLSLMLALMLSLMLSLMILLTYLRTYVLRILPDKSTQEFILHTQTHWTPLMDTIYAVINGIN